MITSQKELAQLAVECCVAYQVTHVVISPGSRNAPLIISFTHHPEIETYSIVDERCAAFFALGIAQQTKKPVAVVCTSGSALLNYYPAVAEAFYSKIPLVVISADRPKHLIDIGDGQTIRQEYVFKNHSLYNANLIEGRQYSDENTHQITTALKRAIEESGPIHINIPFDEPLYETTDKLSIKKAFVAEISKSSRKVYDYQKYASLWNHSKKKLILIGTHFPNKKLQAQLSVLAKDESVLVFTETTSNVHHPTFINSIDKLIFPLTDKEFEALQPEILVTIGGMIVSKKIKQFLRKYSPKEHWHVDAYTSLDTYHCLSQHFKIEDTLFFDELLKMTKPVASHYQKKALTLKQHRKEKHNQFLSTTKFSDLKVFDIILKNIPSHIHLQISNSSIIRYAQLFDIDATLKVFCNRGTSGIDGSTSTAIGAAQAIDDATVFITGDISFFYDGNALWNRYIKNNFRIILINNSGGGIFRFIPGPSSTNALNYFETPHHLTARQVCKMHHFEYSSVKNEDELTNAFKNFYERSDAPRLLEIFTPSAINESTLKEYFNYL